MLARHDRTGRAATVTRLVVGWCHRSGVSKAAGSGRRRDVMGDGVCGRRSMAPPVVLALPSEAWPVACSTGPIPSRHCRKQEDLKSPSA